MAGIWKSYILILYLFAVLQSVENSKLNVPRVLLPIFKEFSTNFTLEVDTGCYKWSTSRIELIRLTNVQEEEKSRSGEPACHKKVIVSSISKETSRNTAIVFAEEINSGRVLRCDVIVDVIDQLNIVTTTRELFMEEAPEAFEVRAYDDQGNEFTTLEGIEFQWNIDSCPCQNTTGNTTVGPSAPSKVLRFITFRDSPYETPHTVEAFDKAGKHGHIVLLEGLKTGSAKVSVSLAYPEYQHVPAIEVLLMVVANLIIVPSDVYLLADDTIQFRILKVHDGHLEEIPLPSSQYFLEVENKEIASLDDKKNEVTALKEGKTKVLLHDRNVNETETGIRAPSATLTVTPPGYLTLDILPHHNWNVLVGEPYEIIVEVYDNNHRKFYLGDRAQIEVNIPPDYFSVKMSTKNNSYHFGFPTKLGKAQVHASMVTSKGGTQKIETNADMEIFECIELNPPEIYVPWDPVLKPTYKVPVIASGGDGTFLWSSTNDTIAEVTQSGLVTLKYQGEANISAAMARNIFNYGLTQVYVLPPDHLQITEYVMEAELGVPIFIHLSLYADISAAEGTEHSRKQRVPFMHCDDLPFLTKIWSENFLNSSLKTTPTGISCGTVAVIGTALGTSKVTISYTHESNLLEDSAVLATYKPLTVVHPISQETILAVGTSREIVFSGGPRPWAGRSAEHIQHIEVSSKEPNIIKVEQIKEKSLDMPDFYVYNILCQRVGNAEVKLHVSNKPMSDSAKRAEATASVRVHCEKPRYVTLQSELQVPDPAACRLNLNSERVVTQNYKDVELIITVNDAEGRPFDNISSLYFEWKLSHPYLGAIAEVGSALVEEKYDGNILLPSKYYQVVKLKGKTGVLEVSTAVVAYQTHILSSLNITPESPPFGIKSTDGPEFTPEIGATVNLIVVEDTIITPNKTQVFNHPSNIVELQVNQGSGNYEFVLSAEGIAEIDYIESTRILRVIPKLDGLLKLALVDLCLVSKPALVEIEVVAVGSIHVEMPERIEREQCVQASVKLYDTSDNPLPVPRQDFLELRAKPDTSIIGIRQMTEKDKEWKKVSLGVEEVRYIITGLELGETNLVFITGRNSREVRSQSLRIQVFPPLRLHPRNLSLAIGAQFQISHRGGPQPDANVEYTVLNDRILTINIIGVVRALAHGCTTVIGKVMGINKSTGNRIKYSEDRIEIHVIALRGINIHSGVTRIKTGNTMPIWAHGIPEQLNPLIIGSLRPPLIFRWSLSNREIGTLHHAYDSIGLKVGEEDQVSMRFTALQPGQTTVKLSVIAPSNLQVSSDGAFDDFLEIEVIEDMQILNPPSEPGCPTKTVLMAPNSEMQLKTSRDGLVKSISYAVGGSSLFSDSEQTNMTKALAYPTDIVTVNQAGVVTANSHLGRASIIIVATEDSGIKQVSGLTIEVKQIQYVMLTPKPSFKLTAGHDLEVLPQGADMTFLVSYHDRIGSEFTTFKSELKLRTNRFDLARFRKGEENDTLNTKLVQQGEMMLKVWDDMNPHHAADYLKINIGEIIYRRKEPLVVGDRVCFRVPLLTKEDKSGKWVSDNDAILHIDANLGIGRAKQPGTVFIKYVLDGTYTFTEIKIHPVTKITFLELPNKVLTNTEVASQFLVPLVLHSISSTKDNNFVTSTGTCHIEYKAHSFPFMCELRFDNPATHFDISEVFAAFQVYDHITGTYGCSIISAGELSLNKSLMETNFTLYVFSGTLLSPPLHIPFAPAVFVHQKEVNLSDIRSYGHITVSGVPQVLKDVEAEASNAMEVEIVKSEDVEPTKRLFYIKLTPYFWNEGDLSIPLSVYIISPITEQRVKVPIKVKLAAQEGWNTVPCVMGKWSNVPVSDVVYYYRHTFTVLGSVVIILGVTLYVVVVAAPTEDGLKQRPKSAFGRNGEHLPSLIFYNYLGPGPGEGYRASVQPISPIEPFKSFRIQNGEMEQMSPGRSQSLLQPQPSVLTSSAMGNTIYGDPMMYYQSADMRQSVRNRRV